MSIKHSFVWLQRVVGIVGMTVLSTPFVQAKPPYAYEPQPTTAPLERPAKFLVASAASKMPPGLKRRIEDLGGSVNETIPEIGVWAVTAIDPDFAKEAAKIPGVTLAVRDLLLPFSVLEPAADPFACGFLTDDLDLGGREPLSPLQWGLQAIEASWAWDSGNRGAGVRVVVADGGIITSHPDLAPNLNLALSRSFVPGESVEFNPEPPILVPFSHASHVAGIIAGADNDIGIVGVAPEAEIVATKIFSDTSNDAVPTAALSAALQALVYSANIGADIFNVSGGVYLPRHGGCIPFDPPLCFSAREVAEIATLLTRATNYANQQGVTLFSAGGNAGLDGNRDRDLIGIIRDLPHVMSISATAPFGWGVDPTADLDETASYTDYGQSIIDFAAPGGDLDYPFDPNDAADYCPVGLSWVPCFCLDMVLSSSIAPIPGLIPEGAWTWVPGTSFSAPHAAGVAALLIGANGGKMHPAAVRATLRRSADDLGKPGKDPYYGYGRVNAANSIE